jgi:hypothetical protein
MPVQGFVDIIKEEVSTSKRAMFVGEPGLQECVSIYQEDSEEYLRRVLFKDEIVLDQFDCYFPKDMLTTWQKIFYTMITFGFYLFYLAFLAIQDWCYKMKWCTPAVYVASRGKLAITNKGRVITWQQRVVQVKVKEATGCLCCICNFVIKCMFKDICAAPITFEVESMSKIFNAAHIRQVSQFYTQETACCCCCKSYSSGVELSFGNFNHRSQVLDTPMYLTTEPQSAFSAFIKAFNSWTYKSFYRFFENVIGSSSNTNIIHIITGTPDLVYNGDVCDVYEDINKLYSRIISSLPPMPDCFVKNDKILKSKLRDTVGNELTGVTIVADDASVEIPWKMLPLVKGEEILNSVGIVYQMTCWDWVKTFYTCGLHYCCDVSPKKVVRCALLLTTKRYNNITLNYNFIFLF